MSEYATDKGVAQDEARTPGKTTIAPDVLLTIVQLTTLNIQGVSRMSNIPGGVNRFFNRGSGEGVRLVIKDDIITADIYVILKDNTNIRDVARSIQQKVERAISEMVGMQVARINVHVEDIDYPAVAD